MRFLWASAAFAALTLTLPTVARANGRFPAAGQISPDPGDPNHLVLRATFGVLESTDAGETWGWICENVIGYAGVEDPSLAVTADGTILAGIFEGLSVSHDRGCSWAFAAGPTDTQYTIDTAVERGDPSHSVTVTATGVAGGFHVVLAQSLDNGATWTQAGTAAPSDFIAQTVDVAPSNPMRVYLSGIVEQGTAVSGEIERSDDRGATWTRFDVDILGGNGDYIGAVDPDNPDRLYVRIDGDPSDTLLVSSDGAKTWKTIFTTKGDMLGFALSPDGSQIALGGPSDGLMLASTSDFAFHQVSAIGPSCLAWTAAGLYGCASEFVDGFTLGLSTDTGATWKALYHLSDLGILSCPAGTPQATTCPAFWPAVEQTIGAEGGGGAASAAPAAKSSGCRCAVPGGGDGGDGGDGKTPGLASGVALLSIGLFRLCGRKPRRRAR